MTETGKHHNSAVCHLSTTLLTRIAACWRRSEHYVIRDVDGSPLTPEQGRQIVANRYTVPADIRAARRTTSAGTGRGHKESRSAPPTGPSTTKATSLPPS
ncbi:hypothetical protein ACIHAX_32230 [Nocardia sp. NPDC051929]|uniref:hypothetical protein n=1 Tax=unclassified Nocardia TaxID=2637762 RepID=UPI0034264AF2